MGEEPSDEEGLGEGSDRRCRICSRRSSIQRWRRLSRKRRLSWRHARKTSAITGDEVTISHDTEVSADAEEKEGEMQWPTNRIEMEVLCHTMSPKNIACYGRSGASRTSGGEREVGSEELYKNTAEAGVSDVVEGGQRTPTLNTSSARRIIREGRRDAPPSYPLGRVKLPAVCFGLPMPKKQFDLNLTKGQEAIPLKST
ncbi:hypothetical protein J6590_090070 [Homalodisca vitripennis]|nr:hypothetical protein J6590_090070 [Homalodisca vitripennis]